ncbi:hypothetical protein DUT91_09635 [Phyllobacterium salinisoli]|uniref:Uncharacterized protein n=2 Tax=Phyllobacterium salinisoli TaxID=1899321 RepID=A0A368K5D8_9HYPH|nr:hypothetical protein DUT91_09635 [Phyllobacterium salinisoli]
MVNISTETPEQTQARLRRVITRCDLKVYDGTYAFDEFSHAEFAQRARQDALALVRDDEIWSQLVPCTDEGAELFAIWRFHFTEGDDNSGFVGWLANHLKETFGTGVFVVCGQNSRRAGIFDYWGCPAILGVSVLSEVRELVQGS